MAIKLTNKLNTAPVSGAYPYGNIKDRVGAVPGTAVNTVNHADFHQFFEKLMDESGLVHNNLPDNETNGYQLFQALVKIITPDPIDVTPPTGSSGVLRYRVYGNRVSIECALTGLNPSVDSIIVMPLNLKPTYTFLFNGNNGTNSVTLEFQSGSGAIVKSTETTVYFIIEYFLD
jgi:hypothetical protein